MKAPLLAAVALALSTIGGTAVAARPCERAVIDDWYDNGTLDRSWSCRCVDDAIALLPDRPPPHSATNNDVGRQLARQPCLGMRESVIEATLTVASATEDNSSHGSSSLRWAFILISLGLAALAGHVVRRRRSP